MKEERKLYNKYIIYSSLKDSKGKVSIKMFEIENKFISNHLVDRFVPYNFKNIVEFRYSRYIVG